MRRASGADMRRKRNRRAKSRGDLAAIESLEDRCLLTPGVVGDDNISVGSNLRNYRLAIAATAEYTAFFGGQAGALAAITSFVTELNAIYEPEAAIHFDLVTDNSIIFTDAGSDGYTNGNVNVMYLENQTRLDTVLGSGNYDIGHVFGTLDSGGSGLASLGVANDPNRKAQGASVSANPQGATWVDLAAHEIGHQFGAEHTFNSNLAGSCSGNREPGNAFEPGSGSTLLGYAGICGTDDLQTRSDPYLHSASFEQIQEYIATDAPANSTTATGNTAPTVNGGSDFVIPANTPFELTASGSDSDGDSLTYNWEQLDSGSAQSLPVSDTGNNVLFRSFPATSNPTRTFPNLSDLLAGNATAGSGEALPTTDRELSFRVTVRDGQTGVNSDDVAIQVVDTGSAFQVTSQNSATTWTGGTTQTLTWDVAGTTASPINASNVRILLSTDGGTTFPFELATTANDGSHDITVPNIDVTTARIKVQGDGNVFFDINDSDVTINSNAAVTGASIAETDGSTRPFEGILDDTYTIALNTDPAGSVSVTISADSNSLVSLNGTSFAQSQTAILTDTSATTVTVRSPDDSTEEGPVTSVITHSVTASTSSEYAVGTIINNVNAFVEDDELPSVIGVDFDFAGREAPSGWESTRFNVINFDNLSREDGLVTAVDIEASYQGSGSFSFTQNSRGVNNSNMLPRHGNDLTEIEGFSTLSNATVVFTWDNLTPGTQYAVYVFGLENTDSSDTFTQDITIAGATTLTTFTQTLTDGVLLVNDQPGTDQKKLTEYDKIVAASETGAITVTVAPAPGANVSIGGLAIREIVEIPPGFTIVESNSSTAVSETATTDTFTVVLNTQPTSNVVLDINSADSNEVEAVTQQLTFTTANWNAPQTVTVRGVDDSDIDGTTTTAITVSVNQAGFAAEYDSVASQQVSVSNTDDDLHPLTLNGRGTVEDYVDIVPTGVLPSIELRNAAGDVLSTGITNNGRISLAGYVTGNYFLFVDANPTTYEVNPGPEFGNATGEPTAPALDLDGDNSFNFATDGIVLLAFSLGTTGASLEPFFSASATVSGDDAENAIAQLADSLDVDGDGAFQFSTDGIITLAHSLGSSGTDLEPFASATATRTGAEMTTRLGELNVSQSGRMQTPSVSAGGTAAARSTVADAFAFGFGLATHSSAVHGSASRNTVVATEEVKRPKVDANSSMSTDRKAWFDEQRVLEQLRIDEGNSDESVLDEWFQSWAREKLSLL